MVIIRFQSILLVSNLRMIDCRVQLKKICLKRACFKQYFLNYNSRKLDKHVNNDSVFDHFQKQVIIQRHNLPFLYPFNVPHLWQTYSLSFQSSMQKGTQNKHTDTQNSNKHIIHTNEPFLFRTTVSVSVMHRLQFLTSRAAQPQMTATLATPTLQFL